jgi:serine/threonine-protein kinase
MYQPPVRPRTIPAAKQVTPAIEAVLIKALAKDRSQRYQSMDAFAEDIARLEQGLEPLALDDAEPTVVRDRDRASLAPPPIAPGSSLPQATISPVTTSPRPSQARAGAVSPLVIALAGVGLLSFVGAGAMIVRRAQSRPASVVDVTPPRASATQGAAQQGSAQGTQNPQGTQMPSAPSATVRVDTQPAGAELSTGGVVVCYTPCALPRPAAGAVSYVVNAQGFERSAFALGPESAPHIQLVLPPRATRDPVVRAPTARPNPTPRPGGEGRPGPLLHPWE